MPNTSEATPTTTNPFHEIFSQLLTDYKTQKVEFYKSVMEQHHQGKEIEIKSLSDFNRNYIKPYEKFLEGCISEKFGTENNLQFLLLNYSFVENHFRQMIMLHEGNACCADKTRAILQHLGEYLKTGTFLEFEHTDDKAFWNPEKIFKSQQEIFNFYMALKQLYHGHPNAYLHFQMLLGAE